MKEELTYQSIIFACIVNCSIKQDIIYQAS